MQPTTLVAGHGIAAALREGTRAQHEAAEQSGFIRHLMQGDLPSDAYADLAFQLHAVYDALERVGEGLRETFAAPLVIPALRRAPALRSDLEAILGDDWASRWSLVPATVAYVAHLTGGESPLRYIANAYTRYVGDVSGGQAIRRMLERHYGFGSEQLAFYDFAGIGSIVPFRASYRAKLDALPLTAAEQAVLVAEAQQAFACNQAVFRDLGERHAASI